MEDTTLLIIFGSEPHAIVPELTQLFGRSDDPILNSFWERSYRGLRAEVGISSRLSTEELPLFSSVTDLCALFRQNKLHPALCQALVCIHHLASFIRQVKISRKFSARLKRCLNRSLAVLRNAKPHITNHLSPQFQCSPLAIANIYKATVETSTRITLRRFELIPLVTASVLFQQPQSAHPKMPWSFCRPLLKLFGSPFEPD